MDESQARAYMTGPAVRYRSIVRPCDNPKLNFAKIRTLLKTEDGQIIEVNPHMKTRHVKLPVRRSVKLDDIMAVK